MSPRAAVVRYVEDGLFGFDRLPLPVKGQDGVSVLLLARGAARAREALSVLTAVDRTWKGTRIRTVGADRIEWRGREIDTVRVDILGRYQGPGGLSGLIKMWVSDDERAIPYRSEMKVSIGSIRLELLPESEIDPAPSGRSGM